MDNGVRLCVETNKGKRRQQISMALRQNGEGMAIV